MYCTIAVNSALRAEFNCSITSSLPCIVLPSVLRHFAISESRNDVTQSTPARQAGGRKSYEAKLRRTFFHTIRAGKNKIASQNNRLGPVASRNRTRLRTPSTTLRYPSTAAFLRRV